MFMTPQEKKSVDFESAPGPSLTGGDFHTSQLSCDCSSAERSLEVAQTKLECVKTCVSTDKKQNGILVRNPSLFVITPEWGTALYGLSSQAGMLEFLQKSTDTMKSVDNTLDTALSVLEKAQRIIELGGDDDFQNRIFQRIEQTVVLVYAMVRAQSLEEILPTIYMYLSTFKSSSMLKELFTQVCDLMQKSKGEIGDVPSLDGQSGFFTTHFKSLVKGEVGSQLSRALSLMIMGGILPERCQGMLGKAVYQAFEVKNLRFNEGSILEYIFSLLDWVIGNLWPAIISGDMSLLMCNNELENMDKQYINVVKVVDMFVASRHEDLKTEYGISDDSEIVVLLESARQIHLQNQKTAVGPLRSEITKRLIKMNELENAIRASWKSSKLRQKPFAILYRGPSSCGKGTISEIMSHVICQANEFPEGDKFSCTINGGDEYLSDYLSRHIVVTFDDMCNTRPERETVNPLFRLIQFINTMHSTAVKADVESKGKVDIRCKLVNVTTNTKDLNATFFSVSPVSIMRRFDYVVDVAIRPECVGANGSIHEKYVGNPMPDIWNLKVSRVVIIAEQNGQPQKYVEIPIDGVDDLPSFVELAARESRHHFHIQEQIVRSVDDLKNKTHCSKHPFFTEPCAQCMKAENLSTMTTCRSTRDVLKAYKESEPPLNWDELWRLFEETFPNWTTDKHWNERIQNVIDKHSWERTKEEYEGVRAFIQLRVRLDNQAGPGGILPQFFQSRFPTTRPVGINAVANALASPPEVIEVDDNTDLSVLSFQEDTTNPLRNYWLTFKKETEKLSDLFQAYTTEKCKKLADKDIQFKIALGLVVVIGGILVGIKMYKSMEGQGGALSKLDAVGLTPKQVTARQDAYKRVYRVPPRLPEASVSSTREAFLSRVDTNLHVVFVVEVDPVTMQECGRTQWLNSVPVGGGNWIVPAHILNTNNFLKFRFQTRNDQVVGVKIFEEVIDPVEAHIFPGQDAALVRCVRGGCCWNAGKYFPTEPLERMVQVGEKVRLLHRHQSWLATEELSKRDPSDEDVYATVTDVGQYVVNGVSVSGFKYQTPTDTFHGLCGALVVKEGRNPVILGVHTAGKGVVGAACFVTQEQLDWKPSEDHVVISESVDFPEKIMGVDVKLDEQVSGKSPVHWLPKGDIHSVEILGQHGVPTSKFDSDIKPSMLEASLEEHLGIVRNHAGPDKRAEPLARQKHMVAATKLKNPMNPRVLEWATLDYIMKIDAFIDAHPGFARFVQPMPIKDALNGVPGVKGFESINPLTSVGWPLNTAKWKCFVEEAIKSKEAGGSARLAEMRKTPDGEIEFVFECVFDKEKYDLDAELEILADAFEEHIRAYVVFRANLKSEALPRVKVEAGKIRVFAGCAAAFVVLCRSILLPLFQAMTYFPSVFESAVGVNAAGKDWEFLLNHVTEKDFQRIMALDFKEYDVSTRADLNSQTYRVCKHILRKCRVSDVAIGLIDGIACEILYPVMEVCGLLVIFNGTNPSGHPGTVVQNGISNSILHRYVYYMNHYMYGRIADLDPRKGAIPMFHHICSLITYGDDSGSSVSVKEPYLSNITMKEQLEKIGIVCTMAEKGADFIPFISLDEFAFLKRRFVYREDMGGVAAPLELESINKSLTCTKKLKKGQQETEAQIMALNMRVALIECFYHSPELFQKYRDGFRKMQDLQDSDGVAIKTYYVEPTEEEIISNFKKTYSCYAKAFSDVDLDFQSGWLDEPPMEFYRTQYTVADDAFLMTDSEQEFCDVLWNADVFVPFQEEDVEFWCLHYFRRRSVYFLNDLRKLVLGRFSVRRQKKRCLRDLLRAHSSYAFHFITDRDVYSRWQGRYVTGGSLKVANLLWRKEIYWKIVSILLPEIALKVTDMIVPEGYIRIGRISLRGDNSTYEYYYHRY